MPKIANLNIIASSYEDKKIKQSIETMSKVQLIQITT